MFEFSVRQKHHYRRMIYKSYKSLLFTIGLLALPFIFFFVGTQVAHVAFLPLMGDLAVSFYRLMAAFVLSVLIAWPCAVLFYKGRRGAVALPLFDVLQSFPTFAAMPLAVFVLGAERIDSVIILFLVFTIIWPIFFTIVSNMKMMRTDWQEAAFVYDMKGFNYFKKFLVPVTLPGVITGSIIGLGEGWEALIATEMIVASQNGLGHFFQSYSHDVMITSFGIVGFLFLIFVINKIVWLSLLDWSHHVMEE